MIRSESILIRCLSPLVLLAFAVVSPPAGGEELDFAGPIVRGEEEIILGAWSDGEIWFHDLVGFGNTALPRWSMAVEQLKNGNPEVMEYAVETYALMAWCFSRAPQYGFTEDPDWIDKQKDYYRDALRRRVSQEAKKRHAPADLEERVQRKIESLRQEMADDRRYRYQAIFIDTAEDYLEHGKGEEYEAARNAARRLADRALEFLNEGELWEEVALHFSDLSNPNRVIGPVYLEGEGGMTPSPPVAAALAKLATGEISDVLETQFGFAIIRVTEIEARPQPDLETLRQTALASVEREANQEAETSALQEFADLKPEIKKYPDRLRRYGQNPEEVLVHVSCPSDPDVQPFVYTLGDFQKWLQEASPSDIANVLEISGGKEKFIEDTVREGSLLLWGRMNGLHKDLLVEREARMHWRADIADKVMSAVSRETARKEVEIDEETLSTYYREHQDRYTQPARVTANVTEVGFAIDSDPRYGERGFYENVSRRIMDRIIERIDEGKTFTEAVSAVWGDEASEGRALARRAAELLGPEATVHDLSVTGPREIAFEESNMIAFGISSPLARQEILSASPGQRLGPTRFFENQPGQLPDRIGFRYIQVEEVRPQAVLPLEECRDEVRDDVFAVQAGETRGKIEAEVRGRAQPVVDYVLLLSELNALGR